MVHSSNAAHFAATCRPLCDDSPEPYPLPDRRLARERRCQIIRAELVIIWLHQQETLVLEIRRARARRVPNKISSPPRDGIVGLCSPAQSAQRAWALEWNTSASRLRSVSTRRATPIGRSAFEVSALKLPRLQSCAGTGALVGAPVCVEARAAVAHAHMRYNIERMSTMYWRAPGHSRKRWFREKPVVVCSSSLRRTRRCTSSRPWCPPTRRAWRAHPGG